MYSVSSDYQLAAQAKNARWMRRLYLGSSDYSAYVMRWPTVAKKWDDLRAQTVTVDLSNADRTFNFLFADPTKMRSTASLKLGFSYVGSEEFVTVFAGTIDATRFQNGAASLTLIDKFRRLSDRKIGDSTSPVAYTGSSYLAHDLAWYACTSLGGLSAIASTSNTDLDYASFSSWTSVFSADNVRMKAHLTGQQPVEILKRIAALTQSAIFIENDKLKFNRFTIAGVAINALDNSTVIESTASLDDRGLINKSWVSGAYDVSSKTFALTVYDQSSVSQVNYGLRESLVADTFVWLTDSASALNLAQRTINSYADMNNRYQVISTLQSMLATIGDAVLYQDPHLGVTDSFRVMGESLNMDTGVKSFDIDQSQYYGAFTLDVSALDSVDVLT